MHPADSHDAIVVSGANENNLRNVSLTIPKRRLTVFAGLSGSGKSSLVFSTIAAESRRLINETYSSFVQGFMPSMARPDVNALEGITTAIIVDQEQMGANIRSTVGTATDATAMLRVLFSRIAEPNAGGPGAYSFNVPSVSGGGAMTDSRGNKKVIKNYKRTGGMCPRCEGTGRVSHIDEDAVVDPSLSINDGAIQIPGYKVDSWSWRQYAESELYPADVPVKDFTEKQRHDLLYMEPTKMKFAGINATYEGLIPKITKSMLSKEREGLQKHVREFVDKAATFIACPDCGGTRLAAHALESKINGKNIAELCAMEVADLAEWFRTVDDPQVTPLITALQETLDNFVTIGLGYLSLDRASSTLSGGEAQRIKMIRHLGSALSDVTYVFDEPTAGLHPHDIDRMNQLLIQLRDKGNTVLVVEHKPQTIEIADRVVELGPGAGNHGGEICFEGTVDELRHASTVTGEHLKTRFTLKLDDDIRSPQGFIEIRGASTNNLRNIDVDIPRGVLTVLTGVAGSGKSSLIASLPHDDNTVWVDQASITGSRRSNPATYTGALEPIRKAFAKEHGVKPALFSPNSEGACQNCKGAGVVYVDLGFMQGTDVVCEVCEGKRFDEAVLEYELGGKNIAEVLNMSAETAVEFCTDNKIRTAAKTCQHLIDVGLGYITLGQPLSTLSGGERQRLKLASHLNDKATLYVLDEPTTGLHVADVQALVSLFDRLVDSGATVVVIEHHPGVISQADHIIDVGPGAGSQGGRIVVQGTPTTVAQHPDSVTGRYLNLST
ncbi:excinuclease ABC subunit UvrA [Corynebacterium breve]|uniref:UvrABC system protein A n=1 Tax=Corynebacterium breve TaxID=3049799 RepID=A0ABY8VN65_9CORY|nr:excinuclease ABC subunit UvrA [Corynebacterium breve]WIM69005.1 excinuclease ABC subunit UvrA [Corynebacterium breve]